MKPAVVSKFNDKLASRPSTQRPIPEEREGEDEGYEGPQKQLTKASLELTKEETIDSEDSSLEMESEGEEVDIPMMEVAQLGPGKSFGELALIQNKPRMATIKCIEGTTFATLDKYDYE